MSHRFWFRMKALLSLFLLLSVRQGFSDASVHQEDIRKSSDHSELKPGVPPEVPRLPGVPPEVPRLPGVPPEVPRLWDELLGLKELVLSLKAAEVERRQVLRGVESQLRDRQEECEQQRRRLDQLEDMQLHQPEELLEEPGSSLRRRVEKLEEQSEGGKNSRCF